MDINIFCRIDARIKCCSKYELQSILEHPLKLEDVYFIEINPMPTVWINNAFSHSFAKINENSNFYPYINLLEALVKDTNIYNFLLSTSMLAFYNQVKK